MMQRCWKRWPQWIAASLLCLGGMAPGVFAQNENLRLSSETARLGREVVFVVSVADALRQVVVMGFDVTYDPAVLQFEGMDIPAGSLVEGWTLFGVGEPEDGRLRIGGFTENSGNTQLPPELQEGEDQPIPQDGGGVIAFLRFTVRTEGEITLAFENLEDDLDDRADNGDPEEPFVGGTGRFVELNLDVDGNGREEGLRDGLMLVRFLFGLNINTVINGAFDPDGTRTDAQAIQEFLTRAVLDIDGNGRPEGIRDGLLLVRFLFGLNINTVINGAIANDCVRCTGDAIRNLLQPLQP